MHFEILLAISVNVEKVNLVLCGLQQHGFIQVCSIKGGLECR